MRRFRNLSLQLALLIGLFSFQVYAGETHLESYSSRPDILQVASNPSIHDDSSWEMMKRAHVEAISKFLELYPDHEIYFLARDAELLYDLAKLETRDDEKQTKKIHLLNISRGNMDSPHLKSYLAQEGISEGSLTEGKKVLFVDTGFAGTIPAKIAGQFPEPLRTNLQSHLICSSNPSIPSCRVFLSALNPSAADADPARMHGTIINYEYMPRYTDRSHRFELKQGIWQPMSREVEANLRALDGAVDKTQAQKYMEDLKYYANSEEGKTLTHQRRGLWKRLKIALDSGHKDQIQSELKTILESKDSYGSAIVRDFIDTAEKNFPEHRAQLPSLNDLGLEEVNSHPMQFGNKMELIKKFPQWKTYLENPSHGVSELIVKKDFQTLRSILDVIKDYEFKWIAIDTLVKTKSDDPLVTKEIERTVEAFADSEDPETLLTLVSKGFSNPNSVKWNKSLQNLIKKNDPTLNLSIAQLFTLPHSKNWAPEFELYRQNIPKTIAQSTDDSISFWANMLRQFDPRAAEKEALRKKANQLLMSDNPRRMSSALPLLLGDYAQDWIEEQKLLRSKFNALIHSSEETSTMGGMMGGMGMMPGAGRTALNRLIPLLEKGHPQFWEKERKLLKEEVQKALSSGSEDTQIELALALNESKSNFWSQERIDSKQKIRDLMNKNKNEKNSEFNSNFIFHTLLNPMPINLDLWREEIRFCIKQGNASTLQTVRSLFLSDFEKKWVKEKQLYLSELKKLKSNIENFKNNNYSIIFDPTPEEQSAMNAGTSILIKKSGLDDLIVLDSLSIFNQKLDEEQNKELKNKFLDLLHEVKQEGKLSGFWHLCDYDFTNPNQDGSCNLKWPDGCDQFKSKVRAFLESSRNLVFLKHFRILIPQSVADLSKWSRELDLIDSKINELIRSNHRIHELLTPPSVRSEQCHSNLDPMDFPYEFESLQKDVNFISDHLH